MVKRIDVLLAAYKGEKYLGQQLQSLREQDDSCFRVLMQDDGSPDGTYDLLQQMQKEDDRFVLAAENGMHRGAVGNFWSLLSQTEADYVAFCDQDDIWLPQKLRRCRETMEAAEERYGSATPLLVHSDAMLVDEENHLLHESFFAHQGWDRQATGLKRLMVQNNVTGCTVLINRALREKALAIGVPEHMVMHDWFLGMLAAAVGKVLFLDEQLLRYRQHTANVKGASNAGLVSRGFKALRSMERGFARIRLTYDNAKIFLEDTESILLPESRQILQTYIQLRERTKPVRVYHYIKDGYTMQSTVTRMGQVFFG